MVNRNLNLNCQPQSTSDRSLHNVLNKLRNTKTIILGIGNILKGDDALGPIVCERLKNENLSAQIINADTVPENYIQTIIKKAPQNLLIIDALDFGSPPGEINIFQKEQLNSIVTSTHTLSPRIFIDMIQQNIALNVYIIGIQPAQIQLGSPVSQRINESIEFLYLILKEIFLQNKSISTI